MSYFRHLRVGFVLGPASFVVGWVLLSFHYPDTSSQSWFVAHFFLLFGASLSTIPVWGLRRIVWRNLPRGVSVTLTTVTLVGLCLLAAQFVIDMVIWLLAASSAQMDLLFDTLQSMAPLRIAFYTAGPGLFFIGLLAYAALLVRGFSRLRLAGFMIGGAVVIIVGAHVLNSPPEMSVAGYVLLLIGFARLDVGHIEVKARFPERR